MTGPTTRRTFIATLASALTYSAFPRHVSAAHRRLDRIGAQLYTVRAHMQQDLAGTLERVAEIGYREVEFAGYFGHAPDAVRSAVERAGLTAPSSHVAWELIDDAWPVTLREARDAGHAYVTIPWLPAAARATPADWKQTALTLNRAGEGARTFGLRLGYHNQEYDVVRTDDGLLPLDVLLAETDPELVSFQLDVYWLVKGGGDPVAYLQRHPGRFTMTHLKDSAGAPGHEMHDVGGGAIDFPRLLEVSDAAGVRHHFVEHDEPADAFASLRASYAYLAR